MNMRAMEELKEMLCRELDEIAQKGEMSAGDLETAHKLTDTIKNIDKIMMLEEDGYSYRGGRGGGNRGGRGGRGGNSYDGGGYGGGNDGGSSYRGRRGTHYVRGHYSRDGGGGYSRHDGKEQLMVELEQMVGELDEGGQEAVRRVMEQFRND